MNAPTNGPGRPIARPTGGRPQRILTVAAAVTLLATGFFTARSAGAPTPAEAAAAVTQRLLPPKAGPSAKQTCPTIGTIALSSTDTDVPKQIADHPGATFCFKPGRYHLPTLTPTTGQRFIGTPEVVLTGAVLLDKGRDKDQWHADAATGSWYFEGQNQNPKGDVNWLGGCATDHPMCRQPEQVFFNDAVQRPVNSLAKVEPGTWFFDHTAKRIYVGTNPIPEENQPETHLKDPVVETSVTREAFASAAANVTISNMVVEKYATFGHSSAIGGQYPGPNWTVTYTEVRDNHSAGIALNGGKAQYNFVHHNGEQGICGIGDNNLVDSNEIAYNNTAGYDFGNGGGAGKFSKTTNLTYTNNYVHDNYGMGAWTDGMNSGTRYENNIVDDNDGAGIMHEISSDAIIKNNLLRGNGRNWGTSNNAAIFISSSHGVQVTGNTIVVAATGGIRGGQPTARMGVTILQGNNRYETYCDGSLRADGKKQCVAHDNTVQNNTIEYTSYTHYLGAGNGFNGSGVLKDANPPQFADNIFQGNTYLAPSCDEEHWFWVDPAHNNDDHRGSFKNWQDAHNDTTGTCRTS